MSITFPSPQSRVLAIDPSIESLGIGVIEAGGRPINIADIQRIAGQDDWRKRAVQMCAQLENLIHGEQPHTIVLEFPSNWFTEKAQASKDAEDIQKLYTFAGMVVSTVMHLKATDSIDAQNFYAVSPADWKGQTPKRIIAARVQSYTLPYGPLQPGMSDDAAEAFWLAKCVATGPYPKNMVNLFKTSAAQYGYTEYFNRDA